MGKKTKPKGDRLPKFSHVRKFMWCSCGNQIDVQYSVGVPTMIVKEYRVVDKGREFNCSGCGAHHDATKEGKLYHRVGSVGSYLEESEEKAG